jgi:hypothetical protein
MNRIAGNDDVVAMSREDGLDQVADSFFVLDEQNRFRATMLLKRRRLRNSALDGLFDAGKVDLEGAAFSRFTVDPDVAATLLDDSVDGREPKASAAPRFLRRVERFEDVRDGSESMPTPVSETASMT